MCLLILVLFKEILVDARVRVNFHWICRLNNIIPKIFFYDFQGCVLEHETMNKVNIG